MRRGMQGVTRTAFTGEMARFCERSHRSCGCHRCAIAAPLRREVSVECGLLPNANGSARVTLGFGATEVLAAVKVSGAGGGCGGNGGRGADALVMRSCRWSLPSRRQRRLTAGFWSATWSAGPPCPPRWQVRGSRTACSYVIDTGYPASPASTPPHLHHHDCSTIRCRRGHQR